MGIQGSRNNATCVRCNNTPTHRRDQASKAHRNANRPKRKRCTGTMGNPGTATLTSLYRPGLRRLEIQHIGKIDLFVLDNG